MLWFLPKISLAEAISSFNSQIKINADASINITETIYYDFGDAAHHGIFRDIPYHYQARGGNYDVKISIGSVTDLDHNPYQYTTSNINGQVEVKIGDPNTTVTGAHTYVINYSVLGAINYFSDHDELYWNVTGNQWQVPIDQATAQVFLPGNIPVGQIQKQCFEGNSGSTASCSGTSYSSPTAVTSDQVSFNQYQLGPSQGLTIVVGFPKGLVTQPSAWQKFLWTLRDNWGLGLPILALLLMFYLWHSKGKDPAGFSTIVAQYEAPEGLTPTEAGTIIDETADNKDISAEIIYLATRGYIKITRLESKILGLFNHTDYQLDLLKDGKDLPNEFEQLMLTALFGMATTVKLSQLKNQFYQDLIKIRKSIFKSVVDKGYFLQNPNTVRSLYISGAVLMVFASIWFGAGTQNVYNFLGLITSALIVGAFGYFMPKRTVKGAQAKQYILGLKMYLSVAEADRLKFFNAPEKSPERFEKLLPYAMVLGVEKDWAKQFEGLYSQPPGWYNDPYGGAFNAVIFTNSLHSFSQSAGTTFASRPGGGGGAWGGGSGFGGGGFSGGGFGGGGGGGW